MFQHAILESPEHDLEEDWEEQGDEFGTDDEELELDDYDEPDEDEEV